MATLSIAPPAPAVKPETSVAEDLARFEAAWRAAHAAAVSGRPCPEPELPGTLDGFLAGLRAIGRGLYPKPAAVVVDVHDFEADLQTVNEWNDEHAARELAERVEAEVLALPLDVETFEALLDMAERAGFVGDDLPEVTGLDGERAEELAAVWRSGRLQRIRDEEDMAAERCVPMWAMGR